MWRWRRKVLVVVAPLLLAGVGASGAATATATTEYPRINGQHHVGRGCTLDDPQVAGGTIVTVAGEEAGAGGGTGAGCDSFVAYELHAGEPVVDGPALEPGVYLHPGAGDRLRP